MKHFTNTGCFWALLFIVLHGASPVAAQQWSAAQQEVLTSMEAYAVAWEGGNQEEIVSFLHPNFHSWDFEENFPRNSASGEKKIALFCENMTSLRWNCDHSLFKSLATLQLSTSTLRKS